MPPLSYAVQTLLSRRLQFNRTSGDTLARAQVRDKAANLSPRQSGMVLDRCDLVWIVRKKSSPSVGNAVQLAGFRKNRVA